MRNQDILTVKSIFSESKTAGIFNAADNVEWSEFFKKLKAESESIIETLKEIQQKYPLVWQETGQIDIKKTGAPVWMGYLEAEQIYLNKQSELTVPKFLSEDQIFRLKDKNDYTTEFTDLLLETFKKEQPVESEQPR